MFWFPSFSDNFIKNIMLWQLFLEKFDVLASVFCKGFILMFYLYWKKQQLLFK